MHSQKNISESNVKEYKTKKGLLVIYDDRDSGHGNLSIVRFYPLSDSSFALTENNFKEAEYSIGFSVGGLSGVLRHQLISEYGERNILQNDSFYGLPLELEYHMSMHLNSDSDPIIEEKTDPKMNQKKLEHQHTVTFVDFKLLDLK